MRVVTSILTRRRLLGLGCVLALALAAAWAIGRAVNHTYAWPYNTRPHTFVAALGDLDGDGDLDAYLANGRNEGTERDTVWLNDGTGAFHDVIEQSLEAESRHVALGDLDGDSDLDAVIDVTGAAVVALNDGRGVFSYQPGYLGADDSGAYAFFPALGDLDGDGDLDLVLGGCCGATSTPPGPARVPFNMVWLNDGSGRFSNGGQRLGTSGTSALALGDLDGDGDLDIFDANAGSMDGVTGQVQTHQPNVVWLNDGSGQFTDSAQRLGAEESHAVALGDLDGDGDLDAVVGNRGPDTVWLNDGLAHFTDSGQSLGRGDARLLQLADLDGDDDLDAFAAGRGFGEIWINRDGAFTRSQYVAHSIWFASALGDVDGDGDADIFAGLLGRAMRAWLNDGAGRFAEDHQ